MEPNERFVAQPMLFWANVRAISQYVGYSERGEDRVKAATIEEMARALEAVELSAAHLIQDDEPSQLAIDLRDYFHFRADVLNNFVEPRLMMADDARPIFDELKKEIDPKCPLPHNKQKGKKAGPALFTCIINMLLEKHLEGAPVDYNPRRLTSITRDGAPLRTLSRWVDGAMPGHVDPIAVWEIKEYYYTTTFGSRVADGVYETLLDGMELEELEEHEGIAVQHLLMVDAHLTWWVQGKSYLCRIIDMLHMGYVDEVLFGREVVERLPIIAQAWREEYARRKG